MTWAGGYEDDGVGRNHSFVIILRRQALGGAEGGDRRAEDGDRRAPRYLSDHLLTEPAKLLPEDTLIELAEVGQVLDLQLERQLEEVRMDDLSATSAPAVALPDDVAEAVDAVVVGDLLAFTNVTERGRAAPDNVAILFPGAWVAGVVDVASGLGEEDLAPIGQPVD